MPMSSLDGSGGPLGLLDELTAEADLELRRSSAARPAAIICLPTSFEMSCDFASSWALASATLPDFEMPPGCLERIADATTWGILLELGEERLGLRLDGRGRSSTACPA